jgi:hypothetical protein
MRRFGNNMGPWGSDFQTDFKSDYRDLYKNWGTGKHKYPPEFVKEFSGTQWAPTFPVCTWEGGKTKCPKEYVKEFSGLGMGIEMGKMGCVAIALAVGVVAGYMLRHKEILVI